jgi:hypothetical protein
MRWLLLLLTSSCLANTYNIGNTTLNANGYLAYTWSNDSAVNAFGNEIDAAVSGKWDTEYGYLSAQVSNNEFNKVRRLLVSVPIYDQDDLEVSIAGGRLTNPMGLMNVAVFRSGVENMILLPLSVYDTRKYRNLPDIVDGVQGTIQYNIAGYLTSLRGYYGKQLLDDPNVPIYSRGFGTTISSRYATGVDLRVENELVEYHLAYINSSGDLTATQPPNLIKYLPNEIFYKIVMGGISWMSGDWKIQAESSYRMTNATSDIFGIYGRVLYNIDNNWVVNIGHSYGYRPEDTPEMHDTFLGISNKIDHFTTTLEYHYLNLNNWDFEFNQAPVVNKSMLLFSIAYSF